MTKRIPRIGIGGPVGCGKSMLIERVVPILAKKNYRISIISNDVISQEDADRMRQNLATNQGLLPENLVIGLATGGCPHTAIREDPSINLSVIEEIEREHSDLDLIIIESGGDNITTTFSPALADYFIYIIDVSGGDKYPRKRGLGIETSDLLVINKIDLAPLVSHAILVIFNLSSALSTLPAKKILPSSTFTEILIRYFFSDRVNLASKFFCIIESSI